MGSAFLVSRKIILFEGGFLMADIKKTTPIMVTQTELIESRGWTKTLIKKFLDQPLRKRNLYGRNSYSYLWELNQIENVEKTYEFKREFEKAERRKASARKAAEVRKIAEQKAAEEKKTLEELEFVNKKENYLKIAKKCVDNCKITIIEDDKQLTIMASKHLYELGQKKREDYDFDYDPLKYRGYLQCPQTPYYHELTPEENDARIIVNFIRHQLTTFGDCPYDTVMNYLTREESGEEAYSFLKTSVLNMIAEAYPLYEKECNRQYRMAIHRIYS